MQYGKEFNCFDANRWIITASKLHFFKKCTALSLHYHLIFIAPDLHQLAITSTCMMMST